MVKATKRMRRSAVNEIILPWLRLRRSFPRFLKRSFDNVSLIPNVSHLLQWLMMYFVSFALTVANYHMGGLFMLSPKFPSSRGREGSTYLFTA